MKVEQFAARHTLDGPEARHSLISEKRLGVPASERSDHNSVYDENGIPSKVMGGLLLPRLTPYVRDGGSCGGWRARR
jgi:hypothetical protein